MDVPIMVFQMAKLQQESEQSEHQKRKVCGWILNRGRDDAQNPHGDDAGVLGSAVTAGHFKSCPKRAVHVDLLRGGDHMVGRTLRSGGKAGRK